MKQLLPARLKSFLWFVFKAPQRRMVGWSTLITDFKGFAGLRRSAPQNLEPVSICTGLKNRSEAYLSHVLASLKTVKHSELIELSVFDCASDDVSDLEQRIRSQWRGKLVFHSEAVPFSRSMAFNKAIGQSAHNFIMACDADISLPADIVEKVNRYVSKRTAWFPIVNWLDKEGKGRFFTEGTGVFAATKEQFRAAGRYDESIKTWGKEDWLLFFNFYKTGISPLRTREKDLKHHWHESLKPEGFKPLF